MKKVVSIVLALVLIVGLSSVAFAKSPADKLTRGIGNVLTGILEIPQTIDEEWTASNNAAIGIFAGAVKGTALAIGRIFSGIWDIVSFPAAVPKDYEPLYKPDYVFDAVVEE
ncbi:exosortase system-associated protein, TIGR04073 family [Candidatus Omnitrophota bacterium]